MNLLLAAERLSPQLVRYDGRTREVITSLLRREHQPSTPDSATRARLAAFWDGIAFDEAPFWISPEWC